jgi:hypothetical protein
MADATVIDRLRLRAVLLAEDLHGDLCPCFSVSPAGFDHGQRFFFAGCSPG